MSDELKPLFDLLQGNQGWLATLIVWIGAVRLAAKPLSAIILQFFNGAVSFVVSSPELDDDQLVIRILKSRSYRIVAFFVDYLASVKLPTSDSVKLPASSNGGVRIITLLALLSVGGMVLGGTGGCRTIAAVQSGQHSAKALTFWAMKDTWELTRSYHYAFALECARKNPKALERQAEVDRKFDDYRNKIDLALVALDGNWAPTTPEEQARLAADIIAILKELGIVPRT